MAAVAVFKQLVHLLLVCLVVVNSRLWVVEGTSWCVARSEASNEALQTALDYACASGADCNPIMPDGLCYLPNTLLAHASYAFNSYFQRRAMAPGSCDFAATATVAKTDPSYGSCMYPSSLSTAGGMPTPTPPTTATNNPNVPTTTTTASPITGGSTGLNNPGLTPPIPTTTDESKASLDCIVGFVTSSMSIMLLLVQSFLLHPIWIL